MLSREAAALAEHRAVASSPGNASAWHDLALACLDAGLPGDAEHCCRRLLELEPSSAKARANLGAALHQRAALDEAERWYRDAVAIDPQLATARFNLAMLLAERGRHAAAIKEMEVAVAVQPANVQWLEALAGSYLDLGEAPAAITRFRRARELDPQSPTVPSNLLFALNYDPEVPPEALLAEHRAWGKAFSTGSSAARHDNAPDPDRRLTIGYLSPDFKQHSVAYFFEPVLAAHDRGQVRVVCYSDVRVADAVTARLRRHADEWRDTSEMEADALAGQVRADRVDLLVDLAGHTAGGRRLALFARKPAPLQACWLGYPTSTGLPQIDCRITDGIVDPEGATALNVERPVRLPTSYFCYGGPGIEPDVGEPPARAQGAITFGSFNNPAKMNPASIRLWARVLEAVPGSRLALKSRILNDAETAEEVRRRFEASGVSRERLLLWGWKASVQEHLEAYREVDIALDSYPYNGATTTCEALWMGVPVVSLEGTTHVARVGRSLLAAAGLPELVAGTEAGFVDIAKGLAGNLPRLARLRAKLRGQLKRSRLMDAAGFTRDLEAAYRGMWREWCARRSK